MYYDYRCPLCLEWVEAEMIDGRVVMYDPATGNYHKCPKEEQ